jgi:hypothetical protein
VPPVVRRYIPAERVGFRDGLRSPAAISVLSDLAIRCPSYPT